MTEENENQEKLANEERAKLQGWVDKPDFRGDPEKWRSAGDFLKIGEDRWPVQNERIRSLETKLVSTHEKLDRQDKSIKSFVEFQKDRDKRAVERAKQELKQEQLQAVEDSDKGKFIELDKQITELDKQPEKEEEKKGEPPPGFLEWCAENDWYEVDIELTAYADQVAGIFLRKNPGVTSKAFFEQVGEKVKEKFPEKFENPNRKKASAVESGGEGDGGGKTDKKTYSNLPPEAKKYCDDFVRDIPGFSKEQYCKDYDWGE